MTTPLRAARWSRVSSAQQATDDRNGLSAQLEEQQHGITSLGAQDTGIAWSVTESGATVHETSEFADMLAQAGRTFDVLVIAYVSRLGRNTIEALRAAEQIAEAGASVYFCDERISTADERQWEQFAREAVEAEGYRRRLRRQMRGSYESRWRRRGIQAGRPPLGYNADWTIDPSAAGLVQSLYTEYVRGGVSVANLAHLHGLEPERLKDILKNRTYLGEAGHKVYDPEQPRQPRYRRTQQWIAGRHEAIIDRDLFERVAAVRAARQRAGGPPSRNPSMLQGRLWCVCGTPVRLDGKDGVGKPRVRHPNPCDAWGTTERRQARYFTEPLAAALRSIRLSPAEVERLVEASVVPKPLTARPVNWTRRRKALRELYDAGKIDEGEYVRRGGELTAQESATAKPVAAKPALTADQARAFFGDFQRVIDHVRERGLEDDLWTNVVAKYFDRIEYIDADHLRPVPNDDGFGALIAETLPSQVVLARPEGFEPPTC